MNQLRTFFIFFAFIITNIANAAYYHQNYHGDDQGKVKPSKIQLIIGKNIQDVPLSNMKLLQIELKATNKKKRIAYQNFNDQQNRLTRLLFSTYIIPHPDVLLRSNIHDYFLQKKRQWRFRRTVYFYVLTRDLDWIQQLLRNIKVSDVKVVDSESIRDVGLLIQARFIQAVQYGERIAEQKLDTECSISEVSYIKVKQKAIMTKNDQWGGDEQGQDSTQSGFQQRILTIEQYVRNDTKQTIYLVNQSAVIEFTMTFEQQSIDNPNRRPYRNILAPVIDSIEEKESESDQQSDSDQ